MPVPADTLRSIKTFPDLVRYLEEELDWPLQAYGFDELTFEYAPAELGLKDADAAAVKTIHQLRPMTDGQPFGIFFVEFERKRMPVVVLRRILSHLVLKQRASANRAGAAAWNLDDLLFISAFGEEASAQREIAFAHFWADPQSPGDLPVLKVLGWDDGDTILHLADADQALRQHLRWPDNPRDVGAWRAQWAAAFTLRHREVIETARDLVEELARLATAIRKRMNAILDSESSQGPIRRLHADFRKTLIHDLSEDDFADVVAQTISYGLLAARFSRPMGISVHDLPRMVPPTNPFLRELLEMFLEATGHTKTLNFDELGIQDVVEVLNRAQADAVKADFGNRTRSEDPVVHFYEHFLKAYDARRKVQRGVFYTPQPVVSYIVRSVHELLQTEFGLEDGLASTVTWGEMAARRQGLAIPAGVSPHAPFVVVLDPATGTGTFLVEVIEVIFQALQAKWTRQGLSASQRAAVWNAYAPQHLFPRLFGYELMMAPYAIAHMKLGLKLSEINTRLGQPDYQFKFGGRAHIYLTNALEPAQDFQDQFAFVAPALAHEAQAVNAIKRGQRFTVVVGNPPYSGHSANKGAWIGDLLRSYYQVDGAPLGERNPKWLQDDYVKFIRLGQHIIEQAGAGVLSFITNHGYLDNPTFRGMRQQLMRSFSEIRMLDLHGNAKKKETAADGSKDENVFDIQQGVAICRMVKYPGSFVHASVRHAHLYGLRSGKYTIMLKGDAADALWEQVSPQSPFYLFFPRPFDLMAEYERGWKVTDIFPVGNMGITTGKDHFATDIENGVLANRVSQLADHGVDDSVFRQDYGLDDSSSFNLDRARAWARSLKHSDAAVKRIAYRFADNRYVLYSPAILARDRYDVSRHFLKVGGNLGLVTFRAIRELPWQHVACVNTIITKEFISSLDNCFVFPLYLYPGGQIEKNHQAMMLQEAIGSAVRTPNLSAQFLAALPGGWKPRQPVQSLPAQAREQPPQGGFATVAATSSRPTPEDIFHYIYAIFHSPTYRARYAEFLKIDFPRVPLTGSLELFRSLASLGGELVALHLLEDDYPAASWNIGGEGHKGSPLRHPITTYAGPAAPTVEKVTYAGGAVWLDKAQTVGFRGVPEAVWNFRIGGYQVCEKWLKDRKGRALSAEDIEHYQRVVVALNETIHLMGEIDAVIEDHGGWPIR